MSEENAVRVARLKAVVSAYPGGAAEVGKLFDINPSYISQLINGHRSFGEKAAIKMAEKMGKPRHFFDQPDGTASRQLQERPAAYLVDQENLVTPANGSVSSGEPLLGQDGKPTLPTRMLAVLNWNECPRFDSAEPTGRQVAEVTTPARAFVVEMPDQSMQMRIPKGARLVIDPDAPLSHDRAHLFSTPLGVICRRVHAGVTGWMLTQDDGRNSPAEPLPSDAVHVGSVVQLILNNP